MKHLLISLIILISLYGCKKTDRSNTHVYGRVVDVDTRLPVSGMHISITYKTGTAGIGLALNTYSFATSTDKDGNYAFSFDAASNNSHNDYYRLTGDGLESYYGFDIDTTADDINNRTSRIDYECSGRIYANIHLIHAGAPNPDDYISLAVGPYPFPYRPITSMIVRDTQAEVISRVETVPNHPTLLIYTIKKNGMVSAEKRDSVVFTHNNEDYTVQY